MDILQSTEHFFMNVLPVATPIVVAWLGYKMPKKTKGTDRPNHFRIE